jgi:membrane fusion protein (multidrug efflux system)
MKTNPIILLTGNIMKPVQVVILATLLLALSVGIVACGSSDAKTNGSSTARQEQAVGVRVQEVQPKPFAEALQATGIIKAYEDVMLSPEEGGVVKEWNVQKGDRVSKGQVLAVLNDELLQANYNAARSQYQIAELNFQKQKSVYEEHGISELQIKSAEYTRDAAKAAADLALARLERTRLRSPIDGVLNDRFVDEGEFAPSAMPIAHLVNNSRIKVAAEVPENYAAGLTVGSIISFTVDAYPEDTLTGTIRYVSSSINPNNRTLTVEAVLANPGGKLKPEMIARVRILRSEKRSAVLINQTVVQQVDRGRYVVYIEKNGKAEERRVKLGGRQGNMVQVLEGLDAGDRLIVSGFQKLVNGQLVSVSG